MISQAAGEGQDRIPLPMVLACGEERGRGARIEKAGRVQCIELFVVRADELDFLVQNSVVLEQDGRGHSAIMVFSFRGRSINPD